MILSPMAFQNPMDAYNSINTNYQSNTSLYEGTPIFLLPSQNKTMSGFRPITNNDSPRVPPPTISPVLKDTNKYFHVFVGDLSSDVDSVMLKNAFARFGEISEAKIIKDPQSLKPKGYGFVSFVQREDAEKAIEQMNGQILGRKPLRTNWASRKPVSASITTVEEVMNMTGTENTTVYIGGIGSNVTEVDLTSAFSKHGNPIEIRLFKEQGYGFVRFETKDSAANAIFSMNGADILGSIIRCSWGREKPQLNVKDNISASCDNFLLQYAAAVNYLDTINSCNALYNNHLANYSFPQQHHYYPHQTFPPNNL